MIEIEKLVQWSKPTEVQTKVGPRILRKAEPTPEFWEAWRVNKQTLRAAGVTCGAKFRGAPNEWEACWWQPLPAEVVQLREQSVKQSKATDAEIDVPAPDGLEYMPFQRAGIRFALNRAGTLIADEMGLGKTIQALGFVNAHPEFNDVLIITKASLKANWWRECRKWLVNPALRNSIGIAEGKQFPSTRVVIINYDIAHNFDRSLNRNWDLVVIDECHLLKNPKSRRAKSIVGYKPKRNEPVTEARSGVPAKFRLALTGTPIENSLDELWTVLWWLDRPTYPSKWKLLKLAGVSYDAGGATSPTRAGLENLQRFLRETIMVRRLKSEVLKELPPKVRSITEFSGDEFAHLIRQESEIWQASEADRTEAQVEVELAKASADPEAYQKAVAKLRHVGSIAFAEMARVRHETAVAKVPAMIEAIRSRLEETRKVIVFAHHTDVLEALHAEFPQSVLVHGGHDLADRDDRVQQFQQDPDCRVFFGSIRATGEGLTLTAATHVMFHEFDWVPSKMAQCEDRAHRIGQRDTVTVEVCVVNGTIDAKMAATCIEKANLADRALDATMKEKAIADAREPITAERWKPFAAREDLKPEPVVTEVQRRAVSDGLRQLAAMCDGARRLDQAGFNRIDAEIGKRLAYVQHLSPRQVVLGAKLVNKYRRQLGESAVESIRDLLGKGTNEKRECSVE